MYFLCKRFNYSKFPLNHFDVFVPTQILYYTRSQKSQNTEDLYRLQKNTKIPTIRPRNLLKYESKNFDRSEA